jgi:Zn-dependent metalloprotease
MKQTFKKLATITLAVLGLNISNLNAQSNEVRMVETDYNNSGQLYFIVPDPSWEKTPLLELPKILGKAYGISDKFTFKVTEVETEEKFIFTRADQMIGNYPVVGGDMIFKRDKSGNLLNIIGILRDPESISVPLKTKDQALKIAETHLNITKSDYFMSHAGDSLASKPLIELKYTTIGGVITNKVTLCYEIIIYTQNPIGKWFVYVNAKTGLVEYKYQGMYHADGKGNSLYSGNSLSINTKTGGGTYFLFDTARNIETMTWYSTSDITKREVIKDKTNTFDTIEQKPGVDVHWGMALVYDYYLKVHKRKSFDGAGALIKNNVRFHMLDKAGVTHDPNAFFSDDPAWLGMYYDEGDNSRWADLVSLDIVGHELSHAVVSRSAKLIYKGESGALNESFADIFGHNIELTGKGANWLMGEECFTPGTAGDNLRDMSDPNNSGDATGGGKCPDTYDGTYWKDPTDITFDEGGVHFNSGLQNYWYYLLTEGGNGTNDAPKSDQFKVTAIGQQSSEQIAYRNLTRYLGSSSDYKAARKGSLLAAQDLFGKNSNEYQQVCNAWFAVGVGEKCCGGDDSLMFTFKVKDTKCHNSKDGEIELTVKNKKGDPITLCEYYWYKNDTNNAILARTKDIINRDSGKYVVNVIDTVNHCESFDKTEIKSPEKLKLTVSGGGLYSAPCDRSFTVTLTASGSGGTGQYTYNWPNGIKQVVCSGPNGFSTRFPAQVRDENNCKAEASAIVTYVPIICSYDPNDIIGPPSYSDQKWVSVKATLPYKIRYENDPKFATGPAQTVTINHKLDTNTSINTFRLGDFGFYKYNFTVPNNSTTYSKRLDLIDSFGIYLDVTAGIDVSTRNAFWIFESIDPKTGLPPASGTSGFLGINDTVTHKGEGYVNYTIRPKSTAKTGDSIRAKAVIVFDANPEVLTPRIHNLIDAVPPTSKIVSLPAVIDSSYFLMRLRGKDDNGGSGLGYFDIFVSENGGAYNINTKGTTDTIVGFKGNYGSTYKAYSIAYDNTDNREATKTKADVSFTIASKEFFKPLPNNTSLCSGDTLKIRWIKSIYSAINLEYTADSGKTYTTIATNVGGADTLYKWLIPGNITGTKKYFVRSIASNNSVVIDTTDFFTLKQGPVFSLGPDTAFCDKSVFNLSLNPGSGYSNYKWSDSTTNQTLSATNYGTYWVRVTASTGCKAEDQISITKNQLPVLSNKSIVNVKCFGNNTGSVDITIVSGTAPYTYLWNNSTTTQDLTSVVASKYSVIVTDAKGCNLNDTSVVSQPSAALTASTTQTNIKCFGNASGAIDLTVTGGTTAYSYSWTASAGGIIPTGQANNQDLTGLVAGKYDVVITDANSCTTTSSVTISQPSAALSASTSKVDVACFGNSTGSIDLSVSGGTTAYSYAWTASSGGVVPSGQANSQDLTGLVAGKYDVVITDANLCTTSGSVTINQPSSALSSSKTQVNVLCFGNSTGSINLSVSGGTTAYSYTWTASSGGVVPTGQANNEDLTGLVAGVYNVAIKDANNCTTNNSATISQPSAALSATKTQVNVLCFGNSTGSIDLTVSGGTTGYTYLWSATGGGVVPTGQAGNQDLTSLVAGNYSVTVTDANSCTTTNNTTISQPSAALTSTASQVNVACFGNSTGSINLTASGGTGSYTYAWTTTGGVIPSGQSTNEDLTGLVAGTYSVTITDANNCKSTNSFNISQPSAALSSTKTQVNVLCFGNSTGSIDLTVSGGTTAYTYTWTASAGGVVPSGQANNQDLSGLVVGNYSVTIKDANNCTTTNSATISQPSSALSTSSSKVDVKCFGNATGSIDLNVSGGTAGYTYSWTASSGGSVPTGQANSQDLTGIVAGNYSVVVTDANGCTSTNNATVSQPSAAISSSKTQVNVDCFGNSTGSIDLTVSGGTAGYTYSWSASSGGVVPSGQVNSQDLTGLKPGVYNVTITDANACAASNSATITQPSAALSSTKTQTDVNCFGNATGAIDLTVNGGTTAYSYLWTASGSGVIPSGQSGNQDLSNLVAGNYSVTVTDANGCKTTNSATITQPSAALTASKTQVNVLCFGNSTGSIDLTVSGGTTSYTYNWTATGGGSIPTGQAGNQDLSGLVAGNYSVVVTDAKGCTVTNNTTISQPSAGLQASKTQVNVLCFGNSTGSIDLTVSGGTSGYSYSWTASSGGTVPSGQQNGQDLSGLTAGVYTVVVTDANGCTTTNVTTITQPSAALTSSKTQVNVLCNGNSTGSIDLTVSGGTTAYSYSWTATGGGSVPSGQAGNQDLTGLVAGVYNVTVTDANGCTTTNSATITQPSAPLQSSKTQINVLCFGNATGSIDLTVSGGTTGYTYSWTASGGGSVPSGQANIQDLSGLVAGVYNVTVTDANGCTNNNSATISQPSAALQSTKTQVNVLCFGDATGSIDLSVTGGTTAYSYSWIASAGGNIPSGQSTNQDLSGLIAGTYTVDITDANGCKTTNSSTILQPAAKLASTINQVNVLCYGNNTGSIDLVVTGGTTGYQYLWTATNGGVVPTGQSTNQDLSSLVAGTYTVTITDANGCKTTNTTDIFQPLGPLTSSRTQVNILCYGNSTGSIDLVVSGGTPNYTYQWNSGDITKNISGKKAGFYKVTITDNNKCVLVDSTILTEPLAPLTSTLTMVPVNCFGGSDGTTDLTVLGGTAPYTYAWSNSQNSQDLSGVALGTYSVIVSDANNCLLYDTIFVSQPNAPLSTGVTHNDVKCFGGNDGNADLTVNGGTTPYTYSWSNTSTNQDINTLTFGRYTVLVTDKNLCTIKDTVDIGQPIAPLSSIINAKDVNCFGGSDGAVTLTMAGGTVPYTYAWSNGALTKDINNVVLGKYKVVVTDFNNCILKDSVTINQPVAPLKATHVIADAKCNGSSDGGIDLSVAGGTTPYTYAWSNSKTTEDNNGVLAGKYVVTITDKNLCTLKDSGVVSEPTVLVTLIDGSTATKGVANGFVWVNASGGTAPYNYTWSNAAPNNDSIFNVKIGTYIVTVRDANGCSRNDTFVVSEALKTSTIKLFPNPSKGMLTVNGLESFGLDLPIQFELYDLVGKLQMSFEVIGKDEITFNLDDNLYNNAYILRMRNSRTDETRKLFLLR